jgi:hypothetical protein
MQLANLALIPATVPCPCAANSSGVTPLDNSAQIVLPQAALGAPVPGLAFPKLLPGAAP